MAMINFLWLIIGFVLLIKGADVFVDGACNIAKLMKVPTMIIGLTVVAFGTSAPELSVSVSAAIKHSNAIALGNVVGSNMVNLFFIAGISAVILPFAVKRVMIRRDYPFAVLISFVLLMLALDGEISRTDAWILISFFAVFMYCQINDCIGSDIKSEDKEEEKISAAKSLIFTVIGLVAVVSGGELTVNSAAQIARMFGLSETFIGLTIIAIGTSLPELVTSIMAARKGESDLAIGNVIGSNIFNILLIIGVSSAITEIPVESSMIMDMIILVVLSAVYFIPIAAQKKLSRPVGICMVLTYFAYTAYLFMR
jgi:cation:H+ antiporter